MKKRILSLLLVATMIMSIFTGCGNSTETSGNGNTGSIFTKKITISEMLNSIIEDEGEVIIYRALFHPKDPSSENIPPLEDFELLDAYSYDGNYLAYDENYHRYLDELLKLEKDEFVFHYLDEPYSLDIYVPEGEDEAVMECLTPGGYLGFYFGNFTRMEINEVSCMVFEAYDYPSRDHLNTVYRIIIKDTDYTKDKVVVFDSPSSESVTVNEYKDYVDEDGYGWTATLQED